MTSITINQGGPEIPDGAYSVTLAKLDGPKVIVPQQGPNAGEEVEIYDWLFVVDEGPYVDIEIQGTTSKATGPRSKAFSWITALRSGRAPNPGDTFQAEDLEGFRAIATIRTTEAGWPRIDSLGPILVAQAAPVPEPAPAAPQPRPVAAAPATRATPRAPRPQGGPVAPTARTDSAPGAPF